jgi:DNA topoisomerase-1
VFDGFLKVYPTKYEETTLPPLTKGEAVGVEKVEPIQHFTEPPARFSEATLVKALEANGIGRPSTYAPTISTLIERSYVTREERRLHPTDIGMAVNDLLVKHFPHVVDLKFTADLEQKFDDIAEGEAEWQTVLADFYGPFKANLVIKEKEVTKKEATETATDEKCPDCGKPLIIKLGRYGKFFACTGYPECKYKKPIPGREDEAAPAVDPNAPVEHCPECKEGTLVQKRSRFGVFWGCSRYPDCKYIKKTQQKTGIMCPECKEGEFVAKRGRGGKLFYSCSRYPECKAAIWAKPMEEKCPEDGWPLVQGAKDTIRCSKKGCAYKKG